MSQAYSRWRPKFSIATLFFLTTITALTVKVWPTIQVWISTISELRDLPKEIRRRIREYTDERIAAAVGPGYRQRTQIRGEGRFEEALFVYERTYAAQRRILGPNHDRTKHTAFYVGELRSLTGQPDAAIPYLQEYRRAWLEGSV